MIRAAALVLVLCPAGAAAAQSLPGLGLPPEARQTADSNDGQGLWPVAVGPADETGAIPRLSLSGTRQRSAWLVPPDTTTPLAVLQSLRDQITASGWTARLACAARVCGGYDFRHAIDVLPLPGMYVDLSDYLYLSATPSEDAGDSAIEALLSPSSRGLHLQLTRISPATDGAVSAPVDVVAPQPGGSVISPAPLAAATADEIGAALTGQGRVILDGLEFDSGSSTILSEGIPVLRALAAWLSEDRARRIALVGHTDWIGGRDSNQRLSATRARSVADWLVSEGGIAASQLESHGVGYLTPLVSNDTETGRAVNRRVEAVLLPAG